MKGSETTAVLPPLYARWMDALLGESVPPETRATCDDCAMCAPAGAAEPDTLYFNPRVKCCTYQPSLANYLVGGMIEEDGTGSSGGRATVERRIDAGVGVTPLGLEPSKAYGLLYQNGAPGFGHAESLRCPHYLEEAGGRCGIWRNRNSVCATWFCKHERGAVGLAFWTRVKDLLMTIERDLAAWCVVESDLDEEARSAVFEGHFPRPGEHESLSAADLDGRTDPRVAREIWGNWLGREREFYGECARRVALLSWDDVLAICGPVVGARARAARHAFGALLREDVPPRLIPGPLEIASTGRGGVRVTGYSAYDPLELAPELLEVLPYFDGRTTAAARRAIRHDLGVRVEERLVRKLADFKILIAPDRGAG